MATTTISLTVEAHRRLKSWKKPGQSFSQVILEQLQPPPALTGEAILERHKQFEGVQLIDELGMKRVREGRKRRSNRSR